MREYLSKLVTAAARWRSRCFEALGFVPSAELYAMRESYNDELRERSCSSGIMRICMRTIAKPLRRLHGVMVM